ncbi:tape measure protein [Vreelandella sp. EE27]
MANDLTLSVTLTGDGRQLSGTLKGAQGDVREFSATTERESQKAETALAAPGRSAVTVSDHLRSTQREARIFGTEATQGGREATQALSQTSQQVQTTRSHFNLLRTTVGLALGAFSVRQVAGMVDGWSDMRSVVGAAIGDMDAAGDMMGRITDIANASYAPLEQTARTYASNVTALRDLGRSAAETADYTESLNHHLVLTATRGQQAESVQNALSRAMAVGKLQADGLETVLANGGEVAQSLANELGVTVSQLRGLASEGKITGDVIASALIGSLEDVRDRAGEMPATIEDGFVRIQTSATRLVGELDQAMGVSGGVAGILIGAADTMTAAIDPLVDNIDNIQFAAGAVAVMLAGRYTGAIVTSQAALAAKTVVVSAATGTLNLLTGATSRQTVANNVMAASARGAAGAIALVGGPAGAAVVAVGALYYFREELGFVDAAAQDATDALDANSDAIRDGTAAAMDASYANLISSLEAVSLQAQEAMAQLMELEARQTFYENSHQGVADSLSGAIGDQAQVLEGLWERQVELRTAIKENRAARESATVSDRAANAVMSDMTVTADALTKSTARKTVATREAAKEATTLATSYENLLDRLNPNRRAARQYAQDLGTLSLAFATGRMSAVQYMQAMGLLHESFQEAQRDSEELATTVGAEADRMATLYTRQLERMDDAAVDMHRSFLTGAEDAFGSFKRLAFDTLAEVIHAYTTRQITASIGFNASGGGMPGAAPGGGFGISPGGIGNAWSAVQNGFGNIQWGGAGGAQAYGGAGFANAATSGPGATGYLGGSMQNFQGMQGLAGAGAGFAGGYAGTQLGQSVFGKEAGSSWGAIGGGVAGTYLGGPLGAAIGGAIGGAIDAAFGKSKKHFHFDFVQGQQPGVFGDRDSALGGFGISRFSDYKLGEQQDQLNTLMDQIAVFDSTLASAAIDQRLDAMRQSVEGFTYSGPEGLFDARLREIVDGSGAYVEQAITAISDPEQMANAFVSVLNLERVVQSLNAQIQSDLINHLETNTTDIQGTVGSLTRAIDATVLLGNSAERLNLQFDTTASGAIHYAWAIQEAAGGVENLSAITQNYYASVTTEAERLSRTQVDLYASLASVTDQVPTTVAELRTLVEAQDMNTTAGGRLAIQLMQLAPAMDETNAAVRRMLEQQYQDTLGRAPDAAGMEYWFNQVATGSATLEQALAAIAGSAEAAEFASKGAADGMERVSDVLRAREQLERQLLTLQGNTAELRRRDLEALDESNRPLQQRVWALQDEQERLRNLERQQQERVRAINQERDALARAKQQLAGFSNSIDGWIANRRGTDAGLASPGDQLAASSQAFYEQYDKAKGGDRDAMNSITQYADRFIEAQKGWSASGTQTTATIDKVEGMMAKLPGQLSAEQFLAEEFKGALADQTTSLATALDLNGNGTVSALERAITADWETSDLLKSVLHQEMRRLGTTVLTEAQIRSALSPYATDAEIDRLIRRVDVNGDGLVSQHELTNARLGGLSSGIANAIATEFGSIDISGDGLIDYDEFRAAFQGMATDLELRRIFNQLDENGDGTISRLEAQTSELKTGAKTGDLSDLEQSIVRALNANQNEAVIRWWGHNIANEFSRKFNGAGRGLGITVSENHNAQGLRAMAGIFRAVMGPNGVNGSHRTGLEYVPYDGYVAELHRGEKVLTAEDAKSMRNDAPTLTMPALPTISPLQGNNDIVETLRELKREVTQLRSENTKLQRESNQHLSAANNQRGAAANSQINAIERSNKMLKRMEDDKRLEAAKR